MAELAELEQKLSALGPKVTDVRALLERVLGSDRSLARLEQLLAELANETPVASAPARAAGFWPRTDPPPPAPPARSDTQAGQASSAVAAAAVPAAAIAAAIVHDTMVDHPAAPAGSAAASQVAAIPEAVALLAGDDAEDAPELELGQPSEPPSAAASEPPPVELPLPVQLLPPPAAEHGPGVFAALFDLSEPPPPRVSYPTTSPDADTGVQPLPPAPEPSPEERRARMDALLDQDLDPNDFPSNPPPPRPAAPAAPVAAQADADVEEAEEGDFELLVEDEEILEIEDAELEIVDDE